MTATPSLLLLARQAKSTRRATPHHDEDRLQQSCVRWFDLQHPHLSPLLHHSPNEGLLPSGARDGAKRKQMGVRAGFPDLILLLPTATHHFLAIELKTPTGRQSPSQKAYQQLVQSVGGQYIIIRTLQQFINHINNHILQWQEKNKPSKPTHPTPSTSPTTAATATSAHGPSTTHSSTSQAYPSHSPAHTPTASESAPSEHVHTGRKNTPTRWSSHPHDSKTSETDETQ